MQEDPFFVIPTGSAARGERIFYVEVEPRECAGDCTRPGRVGAA